ncbi:hypothetical protein SKAU_G00279990 [Synaphobranchus kaupii]|uniref:PAZ domain-containing protein n=1 Tax=Synaphobranchus kaupii TaxID=118154 RepID=A0A9Q1INX5_SYNKA|nr:hypothetical protein SKAU_G00279990 [Synaphobranchus kaupii]
MSDRGRARTSSRSRGRARGPKTAPGMPPAQETSRPARPPAESEMLGRGRQKTAPSAATSEGLLEISAGFQKVTIGERGGRRRDLHDEGVHTRQAIEHVKESKSGTSGSPIELRTNYFRILSRPQWVLFQYHVDFNPPMESRRLRSALLFQHGEMLGPAHTFDGAVLFLPHRLHNLETILFGETRQGEKVRITVTLTCELPPNSPVCLQFYNIIFRRVLRILNMQQIGRHYYNPNEPLDIPQHRLTIWSGFCTAILQYESGVMLCVDISHKVLRSETVLAFMYGLRQQHGDRYFMEACTKELVGLIVLTKYNNKTYRIDEIAWDHNPRNTFKKGDREISFKEYYKTQYSLDIRDDNQVLLVSHVKKRGPSGAPPPGPAMLVPEFCYLTGLTDRMRLDFSIMRDLSHHTRLNPQERDNRLNRFISTINGNPEAQAELNTWGLSFDKQSLRIQGRILPTENILQGRRTFQYRPMAADWTKEMRGVPLTSSKPLEHWMLFFTRRNGDLAQFLLQTLNRVCQPMEMKMLRPAM